MMPVIIDRKQMKYEVRQTLADAQVSPKAFTALYAGLCLVLNMLSYVGGTEGILPVFINILSTLILAVLYAGFILYCMAVRRGERAEFLTLFDGFSLAGKIIGLELLQGLFIGLWAMLFVIPGIVAAYRYRFALFNLLEDPDIGIMKALDMSKRQTWGYKLQLFTLDFSYFGWELLANLPAVVQSAVISWSTTAAALSATGTMAASTLLPGWAWMLLNSLFFLAIAPFYLPNQTCVQLGYFETAKSTSGVGMRQEPTDNI